MRNYAKCKENAYDAIVELVSTKGSTRGSASAVLVGGSVFSLGANLDVVDVVPLVGSAPQLAQRSVDFRHLLRVILHHASIQH